MAKFWLATFELGAGTNMAGAWAIEIIHEENTSEYAVLLSKADDLRQPKTLQCHIGFANAAKACSVWRDRGFPLNDAIIENDNGRAFTVRCPCFMASQAVAYDTEVISIPGLELATPTSSATPAPLDIAYRQSQETPDYAFPATWIKRKGVAWSPLRSNVVAIPPAQISLKVVAARMPNLAPFTAALITPQAVWHGTIELPKWPPLFVGVGAQRVSRVEEFGPPEFLFEDVEVLGLRLNLDELGVPDDALLAKMIERLNYHLQPLDSGERTGYAGKAYDAIPDFRYRPATRTVMLELLRYGKMKEKGPPPPLSSEDYQSQHELLVRILVGRVDDDTTQARDPATFVPTIFVDNPWSKAIGRSVQGFDKWMADFCVPSGDGFKALRPDGRRSADSEQPEELASIKQISLVTSMGKGPSDRVLLRLDCPWETIENWNAFATIDLDLALGLSALAPTRWRQDDFDQVEFRRSFARAAIPETLKEFQSIQVSPIGEKVLLEEWQDETTLIRGTFSIQGAPQLVLPNGTITMTLRAEPTAPQAWRDLCTLLGVEEGGEGRISLTSGNWYRMRCSMNLTIQNSFD